MSFYAKTIWYRQVCSARMSIKHLSRLRRVPSRFAYPSMHLLQKHYAHQIIDMRVHIWDDLKACVRCSIVFDINLHTIRFALMKLISGGGLPVRYLQCHSFERNAMSLLE